MQKIDVLERKTCLPPLAWALSLGETVRLVCGSGVDIGDQAFFEGAWCGEFDTFRFDLAHEVFGTGARLTPEGWLMVPPSHPLECIYVLHDVEKKWHASNSLAFLAAITDFDFLSYNRDLAKRLVSIVTGVPPFPFSIKTSKGTLYLLYSDNALLSSTIEIRPKAATPDFRTFEDYRNYLHDVCKAAAANARNPHRIKAYELLCSLSSGYDSAASAVLAKECGCNKAMTFSPFEGGIDDSGAKVAHVLKLNVIERQRPRTDEGYESYTPEFFSNGTQGEEVIFAAFGDILQGSLFVGGFHGDRIWDMRFPPDSNLVTESLSGTTLGEFRLEKNFFQLPLPFVGARNHAAVKNISNSDDMKPYSIGGDYDRPIPRRILESEGVPRDWFGLSKKYIAQDCYRDLSLLSPEVKKLVLAQGPNDIKYYFDLARYLIGMALFDYERRIEAVLLKDYSRHFKIVTALVGSPFCVFRKTHPFMVKTFRWANQAIQARYREAI